MSVQQEGSESEEERSLVRNGHAELNFYVI